MARSTIQDVAKLAGVSEATVSRALRGLTNVAPATRERVEAAAAELRFTLSKSASSRSSPTAPNSPNSSRRCPATVTSMPSSSPRSRSTPHSEPHSPRWTCRWSASTTLTWRG